MRHIDYGVSVFDQAVFADIPLDRPTDLAVVFQRLVSEHALAGYEAPTRFYEVGTPDGIAQTEAYLRSLPLP
jgi:NDP-sugar pyrophosphorylase family protein